MSSQPGFNGPVMVRWYSHRMYSEAKMMPVVAITATSG